MTKVKLFDGRIVDNFLKITSGTSASLSIIVLFVDIPADYKATFGFIFIGILILTYLAIWVWSNKLNKIEINVEGSYVTIKVGDIFLQQGLKSIPFNEYFDTEVDNKIIADGSLNGIFINKYLDISVSQLDSYIDSYSFERSQTASPSWNPIQREKIIASNQDRKLGKKERHQIGTICVYEDFLLTAFSKFDDENRAILTMPEYLEFLITFWDNVNKIGASGIRVGNH